MLSIFALLIPNVAAPAFAKPPMGQSRESARDASVVVTRPFLAQFTDAAIVVSAVLRVRQQLEILQAIVRFVVVDVVNVMAFGNRPISRFPHEDVFKLSQPNPHPDQNVPVRSDAASALPRRAEGSRSVLVTVAISATLRVVESLSIRTRNARNSNTANFARFASEFHLPSIPQVEGSI